MLEKCELDDANDQREINITDKLEKTGHDTEVSSTLLTPEEDLKKSAEKDQNGSIETNGNSGTDIVQNIVQKKFLNLIDSDSEDENPSTDKQKERVSISDGSEGEKHEAVNVKSNGTVKSKNVRRFIESDSEDDSNLIDSIKKDKTNSQEGKVTDAIQKRFQTLIDSESEEEDRSFLQESQRIKGPARKSTKCELPVRKVSLRASKDEAMRQIHSETQRLLRESEVSLPYHRPKQRTLQEFLNRKKVFSVLPKAPTMAAKLKMSSIIVNQVLEEKEKEAELFYKSSDSEEEMPSSQTLSNKESTNINSEKQKSSCDVEDTGIEETQKRMNNVQDSRQKKEIIQQGSLDLGVPRKLFGQHFDDLQENIMESPVISDCDTPDNNVEFKERSKAGTKQENKRLSIPRKLFTMDCEENKNISENDNFCTDKNKNSPSVDDDQAKMNEETAAQMDRVLTEETEYENENKTKLVDAAESETNRAKLAVEKMQLEIDKNIEQYINNNDSKNGGTSGDSQTLESDYTVLLETPRLCDQEISELLRKRNVDRSRRSISPESRKKGMSPSDDSVEKTLEEQSGTSSKAHDDYVSIVKQSMGLNADDSDNYNEYGLPPPTFDNEQPSCSKKKAVLSSVLSLKPKLKGTPGTMIDLTNDIKPKTKDVDNLINRFLSKHSKINKQVGDASEVTVIHVKETADGLSAVKETLPYKLPTAVNEDPNLAKPGAKLVRLKEDLKRKIAFKRDEEWRRKGEEMKEREKEWNKDEDEEEEEVLSDAELSKEEESESGESEPQEEARVSKKKKKSKCGYIDEEAEVSEDDGMEYDEEEEEEEEEEDEKEDEKIRLGDEMDDTTNESTKISSNCKKFKRVIIPLEEDSNVTDTKDSVDENNHVQNHTFSRLRTDVDMFETNNGNDAWPSDHENDILVSQSRIVNDRIQQTCRTPQTKTDILDFVSPATQLTALNTCIDSGKKASANKEQYSFLNESPSVVLGNTPKDKSSGQSYDLKKKVSLQKKLFDDYGDVTTEDDLLELCSGKFTSTANTNFGLSKESNLSESELLELCSGKFTTQPIDVKELEFNDRPGKSDASRDAKSSLNLESTSLLKNASDVNRQPAETKTSWNKLVLVSSDEEDASDSTDKAKKQKKKKVKRLAISDDEDESDLSHSDEEQEDVEDEEQYVDYDSEENEVVVSQKQIKRYAAGFLENEAELSESDWDGSADEDEKDLDKLELEEGDAEEIDDSRVRDQLGQIHMRQMLDDDQREVRMLQELLFEEGDLYAEGSGRERKFKWRNIDKVGLDNDSPRISEEKDGCVDLSDDEDEVKWRKLRHEREKFLAEKMKKADSEMESDLHNGQIFKLGMRALQKIKTEKSQKQDTSANTVNPMEPRAPHTISEILNGSCLEGKSRVIHSAMQKRSLLARSEASLARIAALAKQRDVPPINRRNFVFTHIDSPEENLIKTVEEAILKQETDLSNKYRKRKSTTATNPRSAKRPKVASHFTGKDKF